MFSAVRVGLVKHLIDNAYVGGTIHERIRFTGSFPYTNVVVTNSEYDINVGYGLKDYMASVITSHSGRLEDNQTDVEATVDSLIQLTEKESNFFDGNNNNYNIHKITSKLVVSEIMEEDVVEIVSTLYIRGR